MKSSQTSVLKPNILVVDDTPDNLRLLMGILNERGYKARPAANGHWAMSTAQVDPPDLILLDVLMPGMNGYEVCERLKADERTRDIPVIFVSALNGTFDKVKAFSSGAVDYINKPLQSEEVLVRVETHLTLQRQRKALEEKNAALETVNKELREIACMVSHDLKTPLRRITQVAYGIIRDYAENFDKDGKEMMELLIGNVKRMDSLINGILQYSRAGRIAGQKEQINLNPLVSDIINMIAPPKSIQIIIENELPVVTGDNTNLERLFQNLLRNAVKFMDKPNGKISIGCSDEGSYWRFSVADNGSGIDEQYYEKIFQVFQTVAPRDEHESTGIGLAIVKKIIELYGGKIWVESTVGQGSTFFFTLPKSANNKEFCDKENS